ncbi:MAG: hypothetical protein MI784_05970 [Cytophagales bacterium]|nr:hypothetical protein [Cytophagales bacterium]
MEHWLALAEKLIWPVFITIILIVYSSKINGLYKTVVNDGRPIEVAGLFSIGEKFEKAVIRNFYPKDLSIDAVEGEEFMVEKGGESTLSRLQQELRSEKVKSIDILKVTDGKRYSRSLLLKYMGVLGIKQVVFSTGGKFDGWIEGSVFSGQLLAAQQAVFGYDSLKGLLAGIKKDHVGPEDKTVWVLGEMKNRGLDNIAVVENGVFRSMINKQDILSALVAKAILQEDADEDKIKENEALVLQD